MKNSGLVRNLDGLGRVVIPVEIRKLNGWDQGQPFEIFVSKDGLMLKPQGEDLEKVQIGYELSKLLTSENEAVREIAQKTIAFLEKV